MKDEELQIELQKLAYAFTQRAEKELKHRLKAWPIDLAQNEIREVVGALLARQVTLAAQLASALPNWNGHVAPLFLRAMADVYINLAWVAESSSERAKKFILYGLGQAKLELEHRRAELATRKATPDELEHVIKVQEDWINHQRATFLTEVNLGSWSGSSTRTMATEADCLDFYNYVYTPFSACVHSTWHHVARYNLKPCHNPLHMQHSIPTIFAASVDPHYLHLAARYLQKTLNTFDKAFGVSSPNLTSALDVLSTGLTKLERRVRQSLKGGSTRQAKRRTRK